MQQSRQIDVRVPEWVSLMGLEWLYELLLRVDDLGGAKAVR